MDLFKKMLGSGAKGGLEYVGSCTDTITTTDDKVVSLTSLTGGLAIQPSEGDIVIVNIGLTEDGTATVANTPTGYTSIITQLDNGGFRSSALRVAYKIMGSTPDTTFTITGGILTNNNGSVAVHVWRGVDQTTPMDVSAVSSAGTTSVLVNPPSITPVTDGAIVIGIGTAGHMEDVETFASVDLSNFINVTSVSSPPESTSSMGSAKWISGAFDPAQWTFTGSDDTSYSCCAATIALRPQQPPPPLTYVGGYSEGYAGTTSTINISLTSLTGGLDTQPSENDIVVIVFGVGGSATGSVTIPTGYTSIALLNTTDTCRATLRAAYKIMGETPDTTLAILNGTGSSSWAGSATIHVWRGVDTNTPIDVTTTTAIANNTIYANPPAITPVTEDAVILGGGIGAHDLGAQTYGSSDLSEFKTVGYSDTYDVVAGLGFYRWESGAFDPAQWSFSNTDHTTYSWCACTIALRPS